MTQQIFFMPAARAEFIDALDWYEREAKGLGTRLQGEVDAQVRRIAANPLQFPIVLHDVRRARLRRFPYSLFFRVLGDAVYVIACFHSSRDPHIWQNRP
ncbi:type II toxin-antitoxin system RelE/ParE family toxin [Methyloferula stellata]|uniref:type II toxin-antitoxin system RelE/ParE family toxin n=1 Tax=Methyloferula stellata TaxID=876270 RepID=UPI000372318B|nr:type II toxin-antitoxin system RelE/ParE family toxin [Methyloferula stellata]